MKNFIFFGKLVSFVGVFVGFVAILIAGFFFAPAAHAVPMPDGYDEAQASVSVYETAPISTLAEIVATEALKVSADEKVALLTDSPVKTILADRISARASAIAAAKTAIENLAAGKLVAHTALTDALTAYTETNYTPENWAVLVGFKNNGDIAVDSATDLEVVTSAQTEAINGMSGVLTIAQTPNQMQPALTGLIGVAPTSALNDGKITGVSSEMEYKLSTTTIAGDANGDGIVNASDLGIVKNAMGSTLGSENWNPSADVNGDGSVDKGDVYIVIANQGHSIWTPVTSTEITGLTAGTYNVRRAAKTGFDASPAKDVVVPQYVAPAPVPVVPENVPVVSSGGSSSGGGGYAPVALPIVYTTEGCAPGNVFSTTNGNRCAANVSPVGQVLGESTFNFSTNLRQGMSGSDVVELQNRLRTEGYFTYPISTGYFGPITLAAVKAYQGERGLPETGFVGPLTIAELNK